MTTQNRWKGFVSLLEDAVVQSASAVERIHLEQSKKPFLIIEQIPDIAGPTKVVHAVHDAVVKGSYASVRLVTKAVAATLRVVIDSVDTQSEPTPPQDTSEP
jgi:hypothetical protein